MQTQLPEFSTAQWDFLAVLAAFGEPISINTAGALAPILPGEFLDLQGRCDQLGWIHKAGNGIFGLGPNLPTIAVEKIKKINSPEKLSMMLDQLNHLEIVDQVDPVAFSNLVARSGRIKEAAQLEVDLANKAIRKGRRDLSLELLDRAIKRLHPLKENLEYASLSLSAILSFSNLCLAAGKNLEMLPELLNDAKTAAEHLGDKRSLALIDLQLGQLYYYCDRRHEALATLSSGREKVYEIGDEDILYKAAESIGLYFSMQGLYQEAIQHIERAVQTFESNEDQGLFNYFAAFRIGYCAAYLGDFGRAIGSLDCNWRVAMGRSDFASAAMIRAVLGIVLLMINKKQDASFHLLGALDQALETKNALALYHSRGGLAYLHFMEGREQEARNLLSQTIAEGSRSGIVRQFSSPWVLEMLFWFDRLGFEPIPGFDFKNQVERVMDETSVHLRGVALRLKAKEAFWGRKDGSTVLSYLRSSEDYLMRSGDPVELAKTRLEMARLYLNTGDKEKACSFAQKARFGLSGFLEELYPDDLRHLLEMRPLTSKKQDASSDLLERFMALIDDLFPIADPDRVLRQMVIATNRFFGAERGGLFWFEDGKLNKPRLRAACHMTKNQLADKNFQPSMVHICKTFQKNQILIVRQENRLPQAILCIPISVRNQVRGVLYHDNSFLNDCFDCLDLPLLQKLATRLSNFVGRICDAKWANKKENRPTIKESIIIKVNDDPDFITENRRMVDILNQAEMIAASEAPVLILGETGVGKELLARKLHRMSSRAKEPFVIVDATTIPETLLESELFGYEKGAFTGAEHQKLGRVEIANKGTLFIDEIGEISRSAQGKLLRVLQEKTFMRIGGTQTHRSDFRLIVATNRDLPAEVAGGEFRSDLYHRINVIPITIPPLRERPEDIIKLADHFMSFFTVRHNCPKFTLTAEDYKRLVSHHWPGNVRELKNLIERSVLLAHDSQFELAMPKNSNGGSPHPSPNILSMEEVQRQHILDVLQKTGGKIGGPGGAAELLGMKRTTLYSRIKKLGIAALPSP